MAYYVMYSYIYPSASSIYHLNIMTASFQWSYNIYHSLSKILPGRYSYDLTRAIWRKVDDTEPNNGWIACPQIYVGFVNRRNYNLGIPLLVIPENGCGNLRKNREGKSPGEIRLRAINWALNFTRYSTGESLDNDQWMEMF